MYDGDNATLKIVMIVIVMMVKVVVANECWIVMIRNNDNSVIVILTKIVLVCFMDGRDDVNHQDNDDINDHDYDDNVGVEISRLVHSFNPDDLDDDDMKGSP
jgi:hypothetical protein